MVKRWGRTRSGLAGQSYKSIVSALRDRFQDGLTAGAINAFSSFPHYMYGVCSYNEPILSSF